MGAVRSKSLISALISLPLRFFLRSDTPSSPFSPFANSACTTTSSALDLALAPLLFSFLLSFGPCFSPCDISACTTTPSFTSALFPSPSLYLFLLFFFFFFFLFFFSASSPPSPTRSAPSPWPWTISDSVF
ncbi:hypothetical protein PanWU01x14_061210 [Parasponia andersonii]|uniref:Transmembrane protein n=1 Tax=Parasponia andersonii TaxID=3476 RepID=A0A2P5DI62_PARAD|nr:hypothetical protein PanWU01x14_061210 [Parasponia andersonii]